MAAGLSSPQDEAATSAADPTGLARQHFDPRWK